MYAFFDEIAKITNLPLDIFNNGFRLINFSNKTVYIEGFTSILNFTDSEIVIKLKKGVSKITGSKLKIKHMNLESIIVVGDILSVETA